MFLERLWSEDIGWDQPTPEEIIQPWLDYRQELQLLQQLNIHRCALPTSPINLQLHGFADASERAYGAAVYCLTNFIAGQTQLVLNWIRTPAHKWKTFISNRVSKIQECNPLSKWHHIPGLSNPADFPSRGIIPSQLSETHTWWTGPAFLHINPYEIPKEPPVICEEKNVLEEKPPHVIVHHALVDISHIQ
ncbi:unnamed protein product, partial [Allacma fusca]